ncbi:hypothetical protein U0070_002125 [Myodes glareolus]|uniref:Receptor-type tyrosine-protein phosphatase eta n=1 Tax=Myodes glareolus TaxID=447135 RepID=A0AAW0JR37_MYOGA
MSRHFFLQVLCTGAGAAPSPVFGIEAVSSPTSVELTWKHNDSAVSEYTYRIENKMEKNLTFTTDKNPTSYNITGLSPATSYTFSITPVAANQTFGDPTDKNVTTEPLPVTDLRVAFMGVTQALLTWSNTSGSASYRMLLKSFGNSPELTPYPSINISIYGLGAHSFCPFPESKETQNDLQVTEDTNGSERSPVANLSQLHRSFLDSVDPPSVQGPSLLEVLLTGLRPDTDYRAVVYSQAADGTEGQPGNEEVFTTNSSQVFDIRAVNISATNMTLTWKIKYNDGLSFPYTYKIHVAGETNSLNQTVNKTEAVIHGLSSSTLYNITEGGEKIENYTTGNSFTIEKLKPGTTYHFEIFPRGPDGTEGPSRTVGVRTDRSAVIDIRVISVGTSEMQLEWGNTDGTSGYNYHIVLVSEHSPHETNKTTVSQKAVTLKGLTPGTLYNVTISPELEKVQGDSSSIAQYTRPSNVSDIEVSTNATVAVIWWKYLDPAPAKFSYCLILKAGDDSNVTKMVIHTGITSVTIADLIPGSSYEVEIFAKVGNVTASPGRRLFCMAGQPSADVLKYTYGDFKKGASDTYVTYLIRVEEKGRSLGLSDVLKYEINVGNQSTTFGYYNGRLEPLGSYRVCVAGFTNITYNLQNGGLINGNESYVSFSQYSDAVFLPQDPGVICGAVFGCILGALAIVAVGGFIFWRKKRSKLIRVENFEAYFKKQQADSNCGFAEEYEARGHKLFCIVVKLWDLKLIGVSLPKYTAEVAENRGKNRYNNVLPYDISRVRLSVQTHSTDDYINANYVPGYHSKKDFIATQGPLPNTLKDFWRMVWEKNVYAIVMLTKCVEQGRTKCEEYWPSKQAQDYGDITVAMTSEVVLPEWTVRDFVVKNMQTSESHPMRQFHFTSWPDHGVPDTTDLLINFRYLVRDYMKQIPPESPILVHCSAGVGRTGTFIAIDRLIYQIENENTVDVYGIVYDLRMHRPLMVQTEDQYVFLNQCVLDIIRAQKDSKVDLIYQNTTAMTIYENLEPVSMFGKTNGYIA